MGPNLTRGEAYVKNPRRRSARWHGATLYVTSIVPYTPGSNAKGDACTVALRVRPSSGLSVEQNTGPRQWGIAAIRDREVPPRA